MSLPVPTEAEEARTLVAWLRIKGLKFTHIGNESTGSRQAIRRGIRMKQQGVSRGVPDYYIITPKGPIWIELKRRQGGSLSPDQRGWIEALNAAGQPAFVAKGAAAAIEILEPYLGPVDSSPF